MMLAAQALLASSEQGPYIPSPSTFELPPIFEVAGLGITKPMVALALSVPLIVGVFWMMSRKTSVVPGRLQFAGEYVYGFVRGIGRDNIGSADLGRFMPLLFALFTLVLVNNYFGLVPLFPQFPTLSRIGFPIGLALVVWLVYNGVGIARHGLGGHLRIQTVPAGVSGPLLVILVPLEFLSNIVIRPATLALRVFATMFAGHMLLVLFSMGGAYLISLGGLYVLAGLASGVAFVAIGFLEMLIMFLQAYVFTLLTAMYIGGSLSAEH